MYGNHQPLASAQAPPMALDVSTGFTAPGWRSCNPCPAPPSCSSFRLPCRQACPMVQHVVRGARDEHTSEERLSRLGRYSHRDLRLNETRLRNAVLTRF